MYAVALAAALIALCWPKTGHAYSVLTHEELIDLAWNDSIRPLLLAKFPGATEAQLREAHSYAYGGSAIQDMGYYPFGRHFFSDLTHYVRSGDFVALMFRDARTIDEYAFAIGALSHYLGDSIGHSRVINPATALEFPKLERKFGKSVTYDESPHGHIRTEFAFDVEEISGKEFAPPEYLRHIGLNVPRDFMNRVFLETYGFETREVLGRAHPALRSYKRSVRKVIPAFAEAEVVLHSGQFPARPSDSAYRTFSERVSKTNYERHWKRDFRGPGFKAHLFAVLVFIVPKVGAISDLAIKIPTPDTEAWYIESVNRTVDVFRGILDSQRKGVDPPLTLANIDLDTGDRVKPGAYKLSDETYAQLLRRLTLKPDRRIPPGVKRNIEAYYSDPAAPIITKKDKHAWEQVQAELKILRRMQTVDGLDKAAD